MTESLHQEEKLSPKKKQKKKEPTSKDGKGQSKKGLAKKAEASTIRGGIEILNSLPAFQTNFPSRSKESTTLQNSQFSLVPSSPNLSQLPSVHTTPQQH